MKESYLLYFLLLTLSTPTWVSCNDWTESEAKDYFEGPSEKYYAVLRAYKESDHPKAFGWFGNWTGEDASLVNSMVGIPDSVDIASIWGNWSDIIEAQRKDLKFCQEVRGTRSIMCFIITSVGTQITPQRIYDSWESMEFTSQQEAVNDFWGWLSGESDKEAVETSIRKCTNAIADAINKYGYDGSNIDCEPNYDNKGNIVDDDDRMFIFVDGLGRHFGPKSGTGKLLIIDGEPQSIKNRPDVGPCFDYFIIQAYKPGNDDNLGRHLIDGGVTGPGLAQTYGSVISEEQITKMTIMTENFKAADVAMGSGYPYTDRYNNSMKSLRGMTRWQPKNGFHKDGVGNYHMETEYPTNPKYKDLRKAIQIINPSTKPLIKY